MIPTNKYCPSNTCNHRFLVDPTIRESSCPSCGTAYRVNPTLRDTHRTRGGFTLELIYGDNLRYELLDFIYRHPRTSTDACSMHLKRAHATIRTHVRSLEEEDLVVVNRGRKPHRISCTKYYIPTETELEAQEEKTCVFCGKSAKNLKNGKCESCVAQQKLIYERFRDLNREAENNINEQQRCKNAVLA